jgi:hypothetical protein
MVHFFTGLAGNIESGSLVHSASKREWNE